MAEEDNGGLHLRIGIVSDDPQSSPYYGVANTTDKILVLINLLQLKLNFTYQLVPVSSAKSLFIGEHLNDSSWISFLVNKDVDFIAARIPILPEMRDVFDVSIPLGEDNWVSLQKQNLGRNSLSGLLSPFEMEVWLLVALSIVGFIPVMFLVYRLYLKCHSSAENRFRGKFSDYILFVVVSLLRQDHKLRISIHSQRILMATWWIAGLVLTTFYTANLTASLARPFRVKSVLHPSELLEAANKDVRWLTLKGNPLQHLIEDKNTSYNYLQQLSKHLVVNGRGKIVELDEAINLTETEGFVFFGPENLLYEIQLVNFKINRAKKTSTTNFCSFLLTQHSFMKTEYGFIFQKNSSLTEPFNSALKLIDQAGLLEYTRRPSFTGKNPCSLQGGYTSRPMQLGDFLGLFGIVGVGLVLSACVFFGEKLIFRWKQWRRVGEPTPGSSTSTLSFSSSSIDRPKIARYEVASNDLLEIEKYRKQIDQLLLQPDKNIQSILHELLYY